MIRDSRISRRHCLIVILGGEVYMKICSQPMARWINQVPLQARRQLQDDDVILLGDVEVTVRIGENEEDPLPGQVFSWR